MEKLKKMKKVHDGKVKAVKDAIKTKKKLIALKLKELKKQ